MSKSKRGNLGSFELDDNFTPVRIYTVSEFREAVYDFMKGQKTIKNIMINGRIKRIEQGPIKGFIDGVGRDNLVNVVISKYNGNTIDRQDPNMIMMVSEMESYWHDHFGGVTVNGRVYNEKRGYIDRKHQNFTFINGPNCQEIKIITESLEEILKKEGVID